MEKSFILVLVMTAMLLSSCTEDSNEQPLSSETANTEVTLSISKTTVPTTTEKTLPATTAPESSASDATSISTSETLTTSETTIGIQGSSFKNPIEIKQENGVIFSEDGKYTFTVTFSKDEIHVGDEFYVYTDIIPKEDDGNFFWLGYLGKIYAHYDEDFVQDLNTTESWCDGYNGLAFSRKFKAIHSGVWNINQFYEFSIDPFDHSTTTYYQSRNEILIPLEILE